MRYEFTMPPQELASLPAFLGRELSAISKAFAEPSDVLGLVPLAAPPRKPRMGNLVCADGLNWDPGAGVGIYWFNGTAWVKL